MTRVIQAPEPLVEEMLGADERRLQRRYVLRKLLRSPTFLVGTAIVLFWVAAAIGWKAIAPQDPLAVDPLHTLKAPSGAHWFGTDDLGRDVLSRVIAGAAPVMSVAPLATLLSLIAGTLLGLVSGYYRGLTDDLIGRMIDVLLSLPVVITAVLALSLLGSTNLNVILVIAFLFTPLIARTVRSAVLAEREREYVKAARLRGERGLFIMVSEILPNITSPIVVEGTVRLGYAVFTSATLAFLQLGEQPPSPDWGLTIAVERAFIPVAPWTVLFPAFALASLIVGVNLIADGLRRAITR